MAVAAVFFADGFEEIEGLSPVDYLRRAGVEVLMVGVKGTMMGSKMLVNGAHNIPVVADCTLEEYLKAYGEKLPDCVVCPGGALGADNLAACEPLLEHLEKCFDAGKLTTANCASPAVVFGKTKILAGKNWTCYPGMDNCAKAEYAKGYSNKVFVTDKNVVTARGPGASEEFSMELVRILAGAEACKKVHDGSQQR